MSSGKLKPIPQFCDDNGVSRTQWFYLKRLKRAPKTIQIGSKEMVSPEAEAEWRREMEERPLVGSLRKLALATAAA